MKIAYLIFAYRNPALLERTVEALSSPDSAFFAHIDEKSDISQFSGLRRYNVEFLKERVRVYWAEFTGVIAILSLMRRVLQAPERYDYLVLLSGSEYPLRSAQYIREFFEKNRGSEFMDIVKIPNLAAGKALSHINTYRVPSHRPLLRFLVKILSRLKLIRRDYRRSLGGMDPYGGHTWWALTREACEYIVEFVRTNEKIVRFFECIPQPEETFFHTILGNSRFAARIRRNILFEDWSAGGAHPAMIDERHLAWFDEQKEICLNDVFGHGEVLFARKFNDENLAPVERLQEIIGRKDGAAARP